MELLEWMTWILCLAVTIFLCIVWLIGLYKVKCRKKIGHIELIIIVRFPMIFFSGIIILAGFLFIDFSKLNLLWIYPLIIFLFINLKMNRRTVDFYETLTKG